MKEFITEKPNTNFSKPTQSRVNDITQLQKLIGNQAVQCLFKSGALQAKLTVSKPDDKYEQEADRVADEVMRIPETEIGRQIGPEEEDEIQTKPLFQIISPLIQRQTEEDEDVQLKENLHRQEKGQLHYTASSHSNQSVIPRQVSVAHEEATEQPHVTFAPFGNMTTYAQLATVARFGIDQVQIDLRNVPIGHPVNDRAAEWIEGLRNWLPYLQQQGSAQLTPSTAGQARLHLEEGVAIRKAIANAQRAVIQREINRVAARARTAARKTEQLQPHLNDCLRAAFRSGETDAISRITGMIGSMIDIGMGFHELARKSAEKVVSIQGVDLPAMGRYVTLLDKLNRRLALFNLAFSLTQTEATTQMEEVMRELTITSGAFSSLATLAGLPAHLGLYANLYLVPLTNAIMAVISRLIGLLQQENDIWANIFGESLINYAVEPGERPMWRFMVSVMQAGSAEAVPQIPDEVAEYLVEHREALEAGSGEEVPTEGWWFWRNLHTERARRWVFFNRNRVWPLFYGNRAVPD